MNSNKQTWRDELRESFEDTSFGGVVFPEVVDIVERALATYREGVIEWVERNTHNETGSRVVYKDDLLEAIKDMGV